MSKKAEDDGFDPQVAADANGVPFTGDDGVVYRPSHRRPLGIGLDRGDIYLDEFGRERPDPTPMAPPVGYKRQPTMVEIIRDQIRGEALRREAAAMGKESWEEADDFDIGDDYDPSSPWEEQFDPVGYAPGALQRHEAAFQAAQAAKAAPPQPEGPQGRPEASEKPTRSAAKPSVNEPSVASSKAATE